MNEPAAPPDATSSRYGAPSRRRQIGGRLTLAIVVAGLLGWLGWAALAAATPEVRSQVVDFRVVDEHRIRASVQVTAAPRLAVTCTVHAQDRHHETTGIATVRSPAGRTRVRTVQALIKTRERAVVVTVAGCHVR